MRINACTWVPARAQQTMTSAIAVDRKRRNALTKKSRPSPKREKRSTIA
jgi:hypothetical protein